MGDFCPYCKVLSYQENCRCEILEDICPLVRRCTIKPVWLPLESMSGCRLRRNGENMYKNKIRFEKNGELYIENGDYVVITPNPFDGDIPNGVDGVISVKDKWYVKGYEPQKVVVKKTEQSDNLGKTSDSKDKVPSSKDKK